MAFILELVNYYVPNSIISLLVFASHRFPIENEIVTIFFLHFAFLNKSNPMLIGTEMKRKKERREREKMQNQKRIHCKQIKCTCANVKNANLYLLADELLDLAMVNCGKFNYCANVYECFCWRMERGWAPLNLYILYIST